MVPTAGNSVPLGNDLSNMKLELQTFCLQNFLFSLAHHFCYFKEMIWHPIALQKLKIVMLWAAYLTISYRFNLLLINFSY